MNRRPAIDRQRNRRKGALTPSRMGATDPSNSNNLNDDDVVCACVRLRAREHTSLDGNGGTVK